MEWRKYGMSLLSHVQLLDGLLFRDSWSIAQKRDVQRWDIKVNI